jgi:hypothetical protein
MWKPLAVIALFLSLPFTGWVIGLNVGDRVCNDPPDQLLRCLDEALRGGSIGGSVGLIAVLVGGLIVWKIPKRKRRERHLDERI